MTKRVALIKCASVLALSALLFGAESGAHAQSYPAKPIQMVVPYPPGGGVDILVRPIGQKLTEAWGQPVVIDNRAGANGNIGTEYVAKSAPDGYTLLLGTVSNLAISPSMYKHLPYDPLKNLAPITLVASTSAVLVVYPSLPVKSVKDLISLAKTKPGQMDYASSGIGSTNHLITEMFSARAGIKLVHVPYKGGSQAINDVMAGRVPIMFLNVPVALSQIKSGRLHPLAVTGASRSPLLPDIPTVAESGFPGFDIAGTWYGLVAPAGTPKNIIAKLNTEIVGILRMPTIKKFFINQGLDPVGDTPEQFADFMRAEIVKWGKVVKDTGASAE